MADVLTEFEFSPPADEFQCADFTVTDKILDNARIVAYMCGQVVTNDSGEKKPYNPKSFPQKAVDIMVEGKSGDIFEIYFDSVKRVWDSKFKYGGRLCKLSPDQMGQFFGTAFFNRLLDVIRKRWPLSDKQFGEMYECMAQKHMAMGWEEDDLVDEDEFNENDNNDWDSSKNMPGKRVDLANKDTTGDGERDYSSTGRKIIHNFSDIGVKGNSGQYYCWPNPKFPFKWSQWKDWTKIKPFAKMSFVYNGRRYGISLSLFDENFQNRGFRGYDAAWKPPLSWLTPGECEQVMKLSIVRKFLRECVKRVKPYLAMKPAEIYEKINNKDKITVKEIQKTQRVIKHVVDAVFRKNKADTYRFD